MSVQTNDKHSVEDGASEGLDEPKLGVVGSDTLELADTALPVSSLGDSVTRSLEALQIITVKKL